MEWRKCTHCVTEITFQFLGSAGAGVEGLAVSGVEGGRGGCFPAGLRAAEGKGMGQVPYPLYRRSNLRGSWKSSWIVPH